MLTDNPHVALNPSRLQNDRLALSRLLQLSSTMLPVGAYSYSQGLEWAIESGDVHNAAEAQRWIGDVLQVYQANFELPVLFRLYLSWADVSAQPAALESVGLALVSEWDTYYKAGRDTAESLAETRQMGYSLCRLLNDLQALPGAFLNAINALHEPAFPTVYAGVAHTWGISAPDMLHAFAWSWLENQVSAAMKTVPLGQVAGQKILFTLGQELPQLVENAMRLEDEEISNFAPGLSMAGCLHETQYSRLFRS